ncbi:MAG TPA: MarR family transcriptional regulator [Terriglobia bacterium]|nr:MarR family transcriptional regulator [Terriglobia bacterium]
MTRLQSEIKQSKPFRSLEEEVYLNLIRTTDALFRRHEALLKTVDLSPAQYNVLRILRGSEPHGLACKEIADRMLSRDPDITRLLDRLERRKLAVRSRQREDRRVIITRISAAGLELLVQLDKPASELSKACLRHLGKAQLQELIRLLEVARESTG